MTRMRIDLTETIPFRIHSKKGWSVSQCTLVRLFVDIIAATRSILHSRHPFVATAGLAPPIDRSIDTESTTLNPTRTRASCPSLSQTGAATEPLSLSLSLSLSIENSLLVPGAIFDLLARNARVISRDRSRFLAVIARAYPTLSRLIEFPSSHEEGGGGEKGRTKR